MDDLINEYAEIIEKASKTPGDFTYHGILAEFARKVREDAANEVRAYGERILEGADNKYTGIALKAVVDTAASNIVY